MKLYYAPGACSLAAHISLHEAGASFEAARVDLKAHRLADGRDYYAVNPKGYVPALELDGGELLTENVAVLSWIAEEQGAAPGGGRLARYRLLEMLGFISSELHKAFKPFFSGAAEEAKQQAREQIGKRLSFLAERLKEDYLLGAAFSPADAYLFVILRWAQGNGIALPDPLPAYFERMRGREAVKLALRHEGLD